MRSLSAKMRLILTATILVAMAWLITADRAAAQASKGLTAQEQLGKQIYLKGEAEGGEIIAILGSGELDLPASSFPCSNCHGLRGVAFQAVAYAAARIFVEAVKNADKRLSRAALINSLERLQGFETGVIGPVTFGPNRRVGSEGSYIVGVDLSRKAYKSVTDRIVPRSVAQ